MVIVQRVVMPVTGAHSWTVLDVDGTPVEPVESYLAYLSSVERSPNTQRAYATSLKLWFEFLDRIDRAWAEVGIDDVARSAVERIFIAVNGPSEGGCDNPQRQGLFAALTDGHRPNNVFGGIPTTATDYSPVWDGNVYEWTADAIERGFRGQFDNEFRVLQLARDGYITGTGGAPFGSAGFVIVCGVAARLD